MDLKYEPGLADRPRDAETGMPYSPMVERIAGAGSRAWRVHDRAAQLAREGRDAIMLTVGDPDFDTPGPINEACFEAIRQGRTHYVPAAGIPTLRQAVAAFESRLLGRPIAAEEIVITSGAQYALYSAMNCVAGPGDEVVLLDPAYATFEGVVRSTGATVTHVSLALDHDFGLEVARLEAALTPRTRAILLNFPHNPTGRMLSSEQIEALARLLRERDIWLISDEVYYSLCFDHPFVSPGSHPELASRTVVVRSLSKSHAMSGWRLGWAVAPGELAGHMDTLSNCILYGTTQFIQDAAVVALTQDLRETGDMKAAYKERRDFVVERVDRIPQLSCVRPDAGIFCMIDVRETGLSDEEFAWRLVEEEAVSLLPANAFGPSGEGYVRLSYIQPIERLGQALERVEALVRRLGNSHRLSGS
jgi:arginine:pyruvate transaminase